MSTIIAITGGIGSGKSIVSRVLRAHSYTVYDCDSEAKRLMDIDTDIHDKLNKLIHPQAVVDRRINRPLIAEIVFSSDEKLSLLNSIVHHAVIEDLRRINVGELPHNILFIETAILYQSHIDEMASAYRTRHAAQRLLARTSDITHQFTRQFQAFKTPPLNSHYRQRWCNAPATADKGTIRAGCLIADRTSRHL